LRVSARNDVEVEKPAITKKHASRTPKLEPRTPHPAPLAKKIIFFHTEFVSSKKSPKFAHSFWGQGMPNSKIEIAENPINAGKIR
jgi:hypothetical protein